MRKRKDTFSECEFVPFIYLFIYDVVKLDLQTLSRLKPRSGVFWGTGTYRSGSCYVGCV